MYGKQVALAVGDLDCAPRVAFTCCLPLLLMWRGKLQVNATLGMKTDNQILYALLSSELKKRSVWTPKLTQLISWSPLFFSLGTVLVKPLLLAQDYPDSRPFGKCRIFRIVFVVILATGFFLSCTSMLHAFNI